MAVGFSRLIVGGFRRLKSVDLPLGPFNVLIGANGVGKSSILDVFNLLSASAGSELLATVTRFGGMNTILTALDKADQISLELQEVQGNNPALRYELCLTRDGYSYAISREALTQHQKPDAPVPFKYIEATGPRIRYHYGKKLVEPTWEYNSMETALAQVPKMYNQAESFRQLLADVSPIYHSLDVTARAAVRMPQTLSRVEVPGIDGEELVSCLYTMRETDRNRYEAVEDALRAAFPTFERLDFPPLAGGILTLGWRERNFSRAFAANELSEGILRFLWLVSLLQSAGLPRVTLIDEPEVSFHPEMLSLLAELMREAAYRTQLIVATHSDRFVRFLETSELVLCESADDGGMRATRADNMDLDEWMSDYTLDQLWNMGRLEGRS